MSTQAFALVDWLVDTWSAVTWPTGTTVKIFDGPPFGDISNDVILFVGYAPSTAVAGPTSASDDAATSQSQWRLLGNPQGNRRDDIITVKGSLWIRRGGTNMRARRDEAALLVSLLESAIRDGGAYTGPPGSPPDARIIWIELSDVTIRQEQTNLGATVEVSFIVTANARS